MFKIFKKKPKKYKIKIVIQLIDYKREDLYKVIEDRIIPILEKQGVQSK